jgi:hypothetical protein
MSTEKAVQLGVRKDSKVVLDCSGGGVQCQRCFGAGHWTYECQNERVYVSWPSQTQQLLNPALRRPLQNSCDSSGTPKSRVEEEVQQVSKSNILATVAENRGRKLKRNSPRKSSLQTKKRRRSKSSKRSSSSSSSEEESPSETKSEEEEEEEPPSSSEDPTSTTYSSSTFSSPSRTTSSSRKSSSYSSTEPPTPASDSENRPHSPLVRKTQNGCRLRSLGSDKKGRLKQLEKLSGRIRS